MTKELAKIYLDLPVEEWSDAMLALDIPNFYIINAATVFTAMTLTLEEDTVDTVIQLLASIFEYDNDDASFLRDDFLPAIRADMADIILTEQERSEILGDFAATMIKVAYAFVWQEQGNFNGGPLTGPVINALGAEFMSSINAFANQFISFPVYDQDLEVSFHNDSNVILPYLLGWCERLPRLGMVQL